MSHSFEKCIKEELHPFGFCRKSSKCKIDTSCNPICKYYQGRNALSVDKPSFLWPYQGIAPKGGESGGENLVGITVC